MIEQDRASWEKGFADGNAGKRDVQGVSDIMAYESGQVEGRSWGAGGAKERDEEDTPGPS